MSMNPSCETHNGACKCKGQTAAQSLDEMEFERGIWHAAQYGELDKIRRLLERGKCEVDQRDSAGKNYQFLCAAIYCLVHFRVYCVALRCQKRSFKCLPIPGGKRCSN